MDAKVRITLESLVNRLDDYFIDDPDAGRFNVHRDLFRDEELFALEMEHVFEASWVFLGHESQLPEPHDYLTTHIGRQPVVIMRDEGGELAAFLNVCPHRGTRLYPQRSGNSPVQMCPYHAWCFDSAGNNVKLKDQELGCYTEEFLQGDHGLISIGQFENYQGFLFGALRSEVPTLFEYLGDTRFFIDTFAQQSADGMEILPGEVSYTYEGNWKMQVENTMDIYHLTSVHATFAKIVGERQARENEAAGSDKVKAVNLNSLSGLASGTYTFDHGHTVFWGTDPAKENRALWSMRDDLLARGVEPLTVDWMFRPRVINFFPNMQFVDSASLQLRIIRPLSAQKTEMTMLCLAPKGEPREGRRRRLRQYEDFYNASGIATPDDVACYEDIGHGGLAASSQDWIQGFARGMENVIAGPDELAKEIGINPLHSSSGVQVQDETVFRGFYREWRSRMEVAKS
ncbi:MAG: Rieske 2Fe-2S domain-containing protein [Immundisolibacteraceae bacterium]|nr:Rieske 2Fe-2S domain-containing protein [Immundisolibacteraceae bacterium]